MKPDVTPFFDPATFTWSYIVADPASHECAIVDPVLDFDPASGRVSTQSVDALLESVREKALKVTHVLETHVHADHLSGAQVIQQRTGAQICIGDHVTEVQSVFGQVFNAGPDFATDGSQFDCRFADGAVFEVGELQARVLHTPGHTPACVTYVFDGAAFVGDTLFMPDYGTARTDFPGGDAEQLFDSIQKILSLPDDTVLYMCHDYLPEGRDEYQCQTSVAEEKGGNVHLAGRGKTAFVEEREQRDSGLAAPRLLLPSIQVNMRAGQLPPAEDNEVRYLKIPLKAELS